MDGQYYNLWSADNDRTDANDDLVIKSVYDPSPVGYSLPASNAFTGFTTTGQNVDNRPNPVTSEQVNAKLPFDKGWYFYTKLNKQGNTFFFPASGLRLNGSGIIYFFSTKGWCWAAGPRNANMGRYLFFRSDIVSPLAGDYYSYGMSVRSAEERDKLVKIKDLRKNGGHCLF